MSQSCSNRPEIGQFSFSTKLLSFDAVFAAIIVFFLISSRSVEAQTVTLTDIGTSNPTLISTNDIYQFSTNGNKNAPDGLNYYTDDQIGHNGGEPGQTFTTGSYSNG